MANEEAHDGNPILTWVHRGDRLEAIHRGSFVVLEEDRELMAGGNPDAWVYPRSALKPMQALPLFASGDLARLGLGDEEAAVIVASHSGDEEHIARIRTIQARGGVPESALACGPHPPIDDEARARLHARGELPAPIHNNCSGKHTGFLVSCRRHGAAHEGYLDPEHPVQLEVRGMLSRLTAVAEADLVPGIDGCGAPNYPLPLRVIAGLFRDLANPQRLPPPLRAGAAHLFDAVNAAPHFLAGRGRFDSALLRGAPGVFLGKCGAEGLFGLGVRAGPGRPALGIAIKVDDGASRGYEHALPGLLIELGLLRGTEESLAPFYRGDLENTQGRIVGHIESRWRRSARVGGQP